MNVTLQKREKNKLEFSPVRPGLRYGESPHRKRDVVRQSYLDRWVLRCRSIFVSRCLKHSSSWLSDLRQHMARLSSLSVDSSNIEFRRASNSFFGKGYIANGVDEMLAKSAYVAKKILDRDPYDIQLIAARELLRGRFVEMGTGEGKTLTMALAAAVSAHDGTPVHVLTASDYLAQRDAEWLMPFYHELGLSVAFVLPNMSDMERRIAYRSDVVHVTGKQVAFDWLRDNLANIESSHRLSARLGKLAQVGQKPKSNQYEPLLRGLCLAIIDEADSLLIDEARTPLVLAAPMASGVTQREECVVALTLARMLHEGVDFTVSVGKRIVDLTPEGEHTLDSLSSRIDGLWRATRYRDEKVCNALAALHCWHRDRDYVVRDKRIELVDTHTGRALPDRRLQHGLHMLLELKESCEVTPENDVVASLPFQSFFLNYVRLCGMSGTLHEVRTELACVYGVDVIRVMPERPSQLKNLPAQVFATEVEQLKALVDDVQRCLCQGRPVLIGTRTVEQSNQVSNTLKMNGIKHNVLNASQDAHEAAVVGQAGTAKQVTVATNMAGRGTDIHLGAGVCDNGGLHVISLAFNESRRLDRQLAGRAARQGQPGSFVQMLNVEELSLASELSPWVIGRMKRLVINRHPMHFRGTVLLKSRNVATESRINSVQYQSNNTTNAFGMCLAVELLLLLLKSTQRKIERRHAADRQRSLDASVKLNHHIAIGVS